jgi:hypothetical protein
VHKPERYCTRPRKLYAYRPTTPRRLTMIADSQLVVPPERSVAVVARERMPERSQRVLSRSASSCRVEPAQEMVNVMKKIQARKPTHHGPR